MKFKFLGKTKEKIPVLGMGTWKMGGEWNLPNFSKDKEEIKALKFGLKLGMRFIDTAEAYGGGHAEELVGKAIKGEKVFIATKVSPEHFHYKDIIKSCNASLKRLGVKQIDLYQLHWPNPLIPIKETMRAMEELVEKGKIRYIGVSNFSVEEFKEAQNALSKYEIVSNQVEYSLLSRAIEKDILPFCKKEKITLIAYSPLAQGKIFGKLPKNLSLALKEISIKYNKTISQIALNWLISKKPVITIPKASKIEHIKENIGALGWKLKKRI
jgi:diketogulonate reductase-like aldo/keto reductase